MPTDAERYNLLLQALSTGIQDIRQAFEVAFGVVLPSAATLNEELNRILVALVHGFGHQVARHLQKLFPKLLISRKSGKPHALASVAHAFLISGHRTPP